MVLRERDVNAGTGGMVRKAGKAGAARSGGGGGHDDDTGRRRDGAVAPPARVTRAQDVMTASSTWPCGRFARASHLAKAVLVAWSAVARQRRSWRRRCDAACRFKLETVDANAKRRTLLAWREQVAANTLRLPTLRHYLVRWTRGAIEVRGNSRGFPWSGRGPGGAGQRKRLTTDAHEWTKRWNNADPLHVASLPFV